MVFGTHPTAFSGGGWWGISEEILFMVQKFGNHQYGDWWKTYYRRFLASKKGACKLCVCVLFWRCFATNFGEIHILLSSKCRNVISRSISDASRDRHFKRDINHHPSTSININQHDICILYIIYLYVRDMYVYFDLHIYECNFFIMCKDIQVHNMQVGLNTI